MLPFAQLTVGAGEATGGLLTLVFVVALLAFELPPHAANAAAKAIILRIVRIVLKLITPPVSFRLIGGSSVCELFPACGVYQSRLEDLV
jgi:hypothetical protein